MLNTRTLKYIIPYLVRVSELTTAGSELKTAAKTARSEIEKEEISPDDIDDSESDSGTSYSYICLLATTHEIKKHVYLLRYLLRLPPHAGDGESDSGTIATFVC